MSFKKQEEEVYEVSVIEKFTITRVIDLTTKEPVLFVQRKAHKNAIGTSDLAMFVKEVTLDGLKLVPET